MSHQLRCVRLIAPLAVLMTLIAGCSTYGLRGQTQSVAGPDVGYQALPGNSRLYGPPQEQIRPAAPRAPVTRYEPPPIEPRRSADIRYYSSDTVVRSRSVRTVPQNRAVVQQPAVTPVATIVRPVAPKPALSAKTKTRKVPAVTRGAGKAPVYDRTGWARWMGKSWIGHKTTSGEIFDPQRLTGAHASLPLPSFLYVTNRTNGRTILIRVNDRVPASEGRAVIVSQLAADLLGFREAGRAKVDIQHAGPAAKRANMKHEQTFLKHQPWFRPDMLRASRTAKVEDAEAQKYPAPTYPRWDGTQRKP